MRHGYRQTSRCQRRVSLAGWYGWGYRARREGDLGMAQGGGKDAPESGEHTGRRSRRPASLEPVTGWELGALFSVVAGFGVVGLILIAQGAPLAHDESVYALRAQFYAQGDVSGGYWGSHRAEGLPLVLAATWFLSGSEPYLRSVVLGFGMLGIVLTWAWARFTFGRASGLLAAALLAMMPAYMVWSIRIGVDVPGTALAFAAMVLFWWASRGARVSWVALGVVPLVAIATAVRYGAPVALVPALAGVGISHLRAVRNSPAVTGVTALGSLVGVVGILLVPAATGSHRPPLMAFRSRQSAEWWTSVADFVELLPSAVGPVAFVLAAGGVLAAVAAWQHHLPIKPLLLNVAIAVGFLVLLNLTVGHGERRYLLPALPFVVAWAAAGLVWAGAYLPRSGAVLGVVALVAGGGFVAAWGGQESVGSLERFSTLRLASRQLGAAVGPECLVLTSYLPQVSWYSGCAGQTLPHEQPEDVDRFRRRLVATLRHPLAGVPPDSEVAALLVTEGKRQPEGASRQELDALSKKLLDIRAPGDGSLDHIQVLYLGRLGPLREGDLDESGSTRKPVTQGGRSLPAAPQGRVGGTRSSAADEDRPVPRRLEAVENRDGRGKGVRSSRRARRQTWSRPGGHGRGWARRDARGTCSESVAGRYGITGQRRRRTWPSRAPAGSRKPRPTPCPSAGSAMFGAGDRHGRRRTSSRGTDSSWVLSPVVAGDGAAIGHNDASRLSAYHPRPNASPVPGTSRRPRSRSTSGQTSAGAGAPGPESLTWSFRPHGVRPMRGRPPPLATHAVGAGVMIEFDDPPTHLYWS